MIPSSSGILALGVWLVAAVAAALWPAVAPVWGGVGLVLALLFFVDGVFLWYAPPLTVSRQVPAVIPVGRWTEIGLCLSSDARHSVSLRVFDLHPSGFEVDGMPTAARIPARGQENVSYRVRPQQRGAVQFSGVEVRVRGRLGLLEEQYALDGVDEVRVYPDFKAFSRHALTAGEGRAGRVGIHLQRRRGEGLEFHQLREYRQGDTSRSIDWKATSRRRSLIAREYREERDQQVVILLDCGRRMRARDAGLSHFDQALNAALLLSMVALRQGDAVGIQAFSGQHRWLPPVKGQGGVSRLLNGVFDLQPTTTPSDYLSAATALVARQRRRALVVLLTNLRDDDPAELVEALALLKRRHLLVVASMREAALRDATRAPINQHGDALRAAAALQYLQQRTRAHSALGAHGVAVIDAEPQELPAALASRYLQIKRSGRL